MIERSTSENRLLRNHVAVLQADVTYLREQLAERSELLQALRRQANAAELMIASERIKMDQARSLLDSLRLLLEVQDEESASPRHLRCLELLGRIDSVMRTTV